LLLHLKPIPRARLNYRRNEGGSMHLWNVDKFYQATRCNVREHGHLQITKGQWSWQNNQTELRALLVHTNKKVDIFLKHSRGQRSP
jgi:Tfp pilus assembly protein PilV